MNDDIVKLLGQQMVAAVKEYVARSTMPLQARIKELEQSAVRYRGVWQENDSYRERDFVTYDGTIWICRVSETNDRPKTSSAWSLMVKHRPPLIAPHDR